MILRDYCVDWIISWVACWIAFMSVFFTLKKLVLKSGSTPPWYLLDTSSTLGGSIEKAPASSIASWHLVDRSSFCSWIWWVVPRYLIDTSAIDKHFLDTYLDSFLDTSRHLICRDLLATLYKDFVWSRNHFFFDLSLDTSLFLSQNTLISLQTCSSRILQAFSSFSLLGKLLILSHSCFET